MYVCIFISVYFHHTCRFHHHGQDTQFNHCKNPFSVVFYFTHFPPSSPSPTHAIFLATNNLSFSTILSFQECGIIGYINFRDCLFTGNIIPWRFIRVVACNQQFVTFYCRVQYCVTVCITIHPLKDIWAVSSVGPLQIKLL